MELQINLSSTVCTLWFPWGANHCIQMFSTQFSTLCSTLPMTIKSTRTWTHVQLKKTTFFSGSLPLFPTCVTSNKTVSTCTWILVESLSCCHLIFNLPLRKLFKFDLASIGHFRNIIWECACFVCKEPWSILLQKMRLQISGRTHMHVYFLPGVLYVYVCYVFAMWFMGVLLLNFSSTLLVLQLLDHHNCQPHWSIVQCRKLFMLFLCCLICPEAQKWEK